jgi:hypothetical protein
MDLIQTTPITGPKPGRGPIWLAAPRGCHLTDADIADFDWALAAARGAGPRGDRLASFPHVMRPRLEQAVAEMRDGRGFRWVKARPSAP